jgi:recombination protein RecA
VAKAALWACPDAEARKLGERTGLIRYRSSPGATPVPKPAVSANLLSHPVTNVIDVRQDNAEGSSRSVELSSAQRAVLVGTLLGDGCLAKHGRHHRLHIKHKLAHRSLVEFKYRMFRDFISMRLHVFDQRLGSARHRCVQFATRTNPVFTKWHGYFYDDGRKTVPHDIARHLSPLALAVWFMDDGAADYAGVTLQTHGFREAEVELLSGVLGRKFTLTANLRRNKGNWLIYIRSSSVAHMRDVVRPYLLPEFEYKLVPRRSRTP